jgi:hypothetical protein
LCFLKFPRMGLCCILYLLSVLSDTCHVLGGILRKAGYFS